MFKFNKTSLQVLKESQESFRKEWVECILNFLEKKLSLSSPLVFLDGDTNIVTYKGKPLHFDIFIPLLGWIICIHGPEHSTNFEVANSMTGVSLEDWSNNIGMLEKVKSFPRDAEYQILIVDYFLEPNDTSVDRVFGALI